MHHGNERAYKSIKQEYLLPILPHNLNITSFFFSSEYSSNIVNITQRTEAKNTKQRHSKYLHFTHLRTFTNPFSARSKRERYTPSNINCTLSGSERKNDLAFRWLVRKVKEIFTPSGDKDQKKISLSFNVNEFERESHIIFRKLISQSTIYIERLQRSKEIFAVVFAFTQV